MAERRIGLRSMRVRTTGLAALVSAVALVAGSALLLLTLDDSLHRSGDDLARGRVHDLAVQSHDGTLPPVLDSILGNSVGQVFTTDRRVLAASPNIVGKGPISGPAPAATPSLRIIYGAPDDAELENYRVWVARADTPSGPVTVVAGSSLESVSEASQTLSRDLSIGVPLLVALVALATWLVVGRTLRPVDDIRTEVAAIRDQDLGRRVPVPVTGDEIGRLALTMNEMLDRLEQSSRRQREFVADASHELRSPVAALRAQLEVSLAHQDQDWPAAARRMLGDTDQMERLVSDLLFLARASETMPPRSALVDLDDVVLEEAARIRSRATVRVDTGQVSAAPVRGDADELRRLVRNLVENAVRHASSVVRLRVVTGDGTARLDVADDGAGVDVVDRDRVFDRFFTADASRVRGSGTGSGLGLAIARAIALRHGGDLSLVTSDEGAHFRLVLPSDPTRTNGFSRSASPRTGTGSRPGDSSPP
ncbi:MAG: HAMP domain-containing sensor histidine kinase [Nocardioidaceae bacterium]